MTACTRDEAWYYYIALGLITFFAGLFLILPCRLIWYLCCKESELDHVVSTIVQKRSGVRSCFSRLRAAAIALISGHTTSSKILVVLMFMFNMTSVVIYLVEATEFTVDDCGPMLTNEMELLYVVLCGIFAVHYCIRFIAAHDKTYFWLDVYSIVDHFTIGPTFLSLYLDRNWLGLKFLRLLYLLQLPEILQMTHIVKSSSRIRLTQIASIFMSIWLCSSGFVHLVENNGDPFHRYDNAHALHYWECVYWLLITMSTVGFGDISPQTDIGRFFILLFIMGTFSENNGDPFHDYSNAQELGFWEAVYWLLVTMSTVGFGEITPTTDIGRAFIIIFIMGTFAMFTSIIPELAKHLGHSTKYRKPYKRIYGKRHIVVCGHISYGSVSNFIRNFIHEDTGITNTNVVFVDNQKPDLELEAYFKRHMNDVTFLQGSVMEMRTLKNIKLRYCDAVLILANRNCDDPDEQDSANIMRATAVKNYFPEVRVIIQLLQQYNKSYLLHIPNWNWDKPNSDDVICLSELKLGLLAQSCLAPGVCTLMANLFTMRSFKIGNTRSWQDIYRYGAGNEIYSEHFSSAFVGMSFAQASEICFTEFNVLLIGVAAGNHSRLRINPTNLTIGIDMTGFFIAQSPVQVKKVSEYRLTSSSVYHGVEKNGNKLDAGVDVVIPLNSQPLQQAQYTEQDYPDHYLEYLEEVGSRLASHSAISPSHTPPTERKNRQSRGVGGGKRRLGSTEKHRLVSLTSQEGETLDVTGQFYWTPPQRLDDCLLDADGVADRNFEGHVVLILLADGGCPLVGLNNFIMPLRTAHIKSDDLMDIVIMTDVDFVMKEWPNISCYPRIFVFPGSPAHRPDMRVLNLEKSAMCVVVSAKKHIVVDATLLDKETILTALNVKGMFGDDVENKIKSIGVLKNVDAFRSYMAKMKEIPLTVDLEFDENVAFLDQDDDDDPDIPLYMTHPYCSGSAFAASSLDSLLSATYVNSKILSVVRALITGAETAEIEQILAEALGIVRKNREGTTTRDRCHLTQLPLATGILAGLQVGHLYGTLFVKALREHGILCMGLYRLMDPYSHGSSRKRYVITSPPSEFETLTSDKVFCLRPFPPSTEGSTAGKPSASKPKRSPESSHLDPPAYETTSNTSSYEGLSDPTRPKYSHTTSPQDDSHVSKL